MTDPGHTNPASAAPGLAILLISTLYPNSAQPRHGIFVETRLRHLMRAKGVQAKVIAPVPWFPSWLGRFRKYSQFSRVPARETLKGIEVFHPRYLVIPKIGMLLTPFFMAWSVWRCARQVQQAGYDYRLIDAHYFYPDGVAVSCIARLLKRPFIVTARGTDINLIPESYLPRKMVLHCAREAAASITVCQALKTRMVEIGADEAKIHVLRNGVDLELFQPYPREPVRERYHLSQTVLLSVGHFIERKGHHFVIDALAELPDCQLVLVGDGEMFEDLRRRADNMGVSSRVVFTGALSQRDLAGVYSAADVMILASSREGWANVLLESMACGTPVVANSIWGTPEVVTAPAAGLLIEERSGAAIARGVRDLLANYPATAATRKYAERFSWGATIDGLEAVMLDARVTGPQARPS